MKSASVQGGSKRKKEVGEMDERGQKVKKRKRKFDL